MDVASPHFLDALSRSSGAVWREQELHASTATGRRRRSTHYSAEEANAVQLAARMAERWDKAEPLPLGARGGRPLRKQFETIHDTLVAQGEAYPQARRDVVAEAVHGTPRTPLRADSAR
jgi:hypothetical protein